MKKTEGEFVGRWGEDLGYSTGASLSIPRPPILGSSGGRAWSRNRYSYYHEKRISIPRLLWFFLKAEFKLRINCKIISRVVWHSRIDLRISLAAKCD